MQDDESHAVSDASQRFARGMPAAKDSARKASGACARAGLCATVVEAGMLCS
jgi:hypothetical protein